MDNQTIKLQTIAFLDTGDSSSLATIAEILGTTLEQNQDQHTAAMVLSDPEKQRLAATVLQAFATQYTQHLLVGYGMHLSEYVASSGKSVGVFQVEIYKNGPGTPHNKSNSEQNLAKIFNIIGQPHLAELAGKLTSGPDPLKYPNIEHVSDHKKNPPELVFIFEGDRDKGPAKIHRIEARGVTKTLPSTENNLLHFTPPSSTPGNPTGK